MEKRVKIIVASILIVFFAVTLPLSYVVASFYLQSNHVSGTINTVGLALTANNTNVVTNDILLLSAHLNNSKVGITVQFFNGSTALNPSVLTDINGIATSYYNVTNSAYYDLYAIATLP